MKAHILYVCLFFPDTIPIARAFISHDPFPVRFNA